MAGVVKGMSQWRTRSQRSQWLGTSFACAHAEGQFYPHGAWLPSSAPSISMANLGMRYAQHGCHLSPRCADWNTRVRAQLVNEGSREIRSIASSPQGRFSAFICAPTKVPIAL